MATTLKCVVNSKINIYYILFTLPFMMAVTTLLPLNAVQTVEDDN